MQYRITDNKNRVTTSSRSLSELRADPQIVLIEKFNPGNGSYTPVDRHDGAEWQNEDRQMLLS